MNLRIADYLRYIVFWVVLLPYGLYASEPQSDGKETGELNVTELLLHHVLDSHDWHIVDIPIGGGQYIPVSVPLPWLIYDSEKGIKFFFLHGHDAQEINAAAREKGYAIDEHGHIRSLSGASVLDLSPTKTVFQMMLVGLVMLLLFTRIAAAYAERPHQAPKGAQSLFEPLIVFIRDEIAKPNLHGKHEAFVPYLLTTFFFIWFANMFGIMPLNSNIAGNISVTAALAVLSFILIQFNGTKDYWGHIFWFPGLPVPLKILMMVVELVGLLTKPVALAIRLFANISAGHFMILSLVSLIFILGKNGQSPGGALGILPLSLAFSLFILTVEVLVAVVQAYIFTLLTAVFIGQAMETHEHDHEPEGAVARSGH
jgi:F-type H+-transporting ATPase subunit a